MSESLLGKIINDRYHLKKVLGKGGMGIVFEAEDLRLSGRPCAVKLLKSQGSSFNILQRFKAELQMISRLRSPHIVQVLDTGYYEEHHLYIVMELLDGEPLSQLIKRETRLSIPQSIHIIKGILAGLDEAHNLGIIHRDLKPDNIFITKTSLGDVVVKILDFGIAKDILDESEKLTSTDMMIGTPKYMAPEQFMKKLASPQTDFYATGLLFYQLIQGSPPFLTESTLLPDTLNSFPSEFKLGWLHLNAKPEPIDIPKPLWSLIEKMLSKEPDDRPINTREIIDQLNKVLMNISLTDGVSPSFSMHLPPSVHDDTINQAHHVGLEDAHQDRHPQIKEDFAHKRSSSRLKEDKAEHSKGQTPSKKDSESSNQSPLNQVTYSGQADASLISPQPKRSFALSSPLLLLIVAALVGGAIWVIIGEKKTNKDDGKGKPLVLGEQNIPHLVSPQKKQPTQSLASTQKTPTSTHQKTQPSQGDTSSSDQMKTSSSKASAQSGEPTHSSPPTSPPKKSLAPKRVKLKLSPNKVVYEPKEKIRLRVSSDPPSKSRITYKISPRSLGKISRGKLVLSGRVKRGTIQACILKVCSKKTSIRVSDEEEPPE